MADERARGSGHARPVALDPALIRDVDRWRLAMARSLVASGAERGGVDEAVRTTLGRLMFARMAEALGLAGRLDRLGAAPGIHEAILGMWPGAVTGEGRVDDEVLRAIIAELRGPGTAALATEALGQVYEHCRATPIAVATDGTPVLAPHSTGRKAGGVYYTPPHIIEHVVAHTLAPLASEHGRIVDPSCGAGAFLLSAYRHVLAARAGVRDLEARLALLGHVHGVDIDPGAVEITRLSLLLCMLDGAAPGQAAALGDEALAAVWRELGARIRHGDALIGSDFRAVTGMAPDAAGVTQPLDWEAAFPGVFGSGGFDAVVGNPPWGQKAIATSPAARRYLRRRFTSLAGIFDLFRPFVEQSVRLVRPGGQLGLVLPDVILLKDYPATRRLLLERLRLRRIDWWGMAFSGATIDAATIIGSAEPAPLEHRVRVVVRDGRASLDHTIAQEHFRDNDRYALNLLLTEERRAIVRALAPLPRLHTCFEVHEGVHSGNMRSELFVDAAVDGSCRPLLFGGGELVPYALRWRGRHVRLDAMAEASGSGRYANVGRPAWFEPPKLVVRRTGDRVIAAVDEAGRYASNNFFVIVPRAAGAGLHGLCALLNSRLMTWYFRAIEPRKGRAFAELKIKHIAAFPLPGAVAAGGAIDELGARRARLAEAALAGQDVGASMAELDRRIDALVYELYGLGAADIARIEAER